jgi:hypothetical protein
VNVSSNHVLNFSFQPPFNGWGFTSIYQKLFDALKDVYDIQYSDHTLYDNNYPHTTGPHHLIISNENTKRYKLCTYWDRAIEVLNDDCGWDNQNCLGIYSAIDSGISSKLIPTSYCCMNKDIESKIQKIEKCFENKKNYDLIFRGYLHSSRFFLKDICDGKIIMTDKRLNAEEYVQELNSYAIGLSINGAAEICNRDMEILGVGSVLLRPKLIRTKFHNPLIEGEHYIGYGFHEDPKKELENLWARYNSVKDNKDYLSYVASNGFKWYNENGTAEANANILKQIINLEDLYE